MLAKKQIELSITPFLILPERLDFIDFTVLTWTTTLTVIFLHPQTGLKNIFLEPLSAWVWILTLVLMFVVSCLVTITTKLHFGRVRKITFIRAFITTFAIMCQQGFIESFQKLSTRMLLLSSILFSLIIYQFYSSYIVSSLLTDPPKTITTLRKLIDSDLDVGIESTSYTKDFFEKTTDSLSKELFAKKKIRQKNNILTAEEGLEKLKKGGFAFTVDTSYAYKILKKTLNDDETCELHEIFIKALIPRRPLRPAVLKRSPLREFFVVGMQRLKESGIIDYHNQRWSDSKPKCVKSQAAVKTVRMEEASAIFLFLFFAILTSFCVLSFELVHFKYFYGKKKSAEGLSLKQNSLGLR